MKRGRSAEPPVEPPAGANRPTRSLSRLAARYEISATGVGQLTRLQDLLARDPQAPTTVRVPARIREDHLADALVALTLEPVCAATHIADLGAGAGVPGLPLAIALPAAQVILVESNGRKCGFIRRAIEVCAVANASVVCARAEAWPEGLERFELVTARALAPLAVVAEYAAPLLRVGGALVVWRGRRDPADEAAGTQAAAELGLEPDQPVHVEPYPGATNRHLQVMLKTGPTPMRFPRRPGVARKRPLGGGRR